MFPLPLPEAAALRFLDVSCILGSAWAFLFFVAGKCIFQAPIPCTVTVKFLTMPPGTLPSPAPSYPATCAFCYFWNTTANSCRGPGPLLPFSLEAYPQDSYMANSLLPSVRFSLESKLRGLTFPSVATLKRDHLLPQTLTILLPSYFSLVSDILERSAV